MPNMLTLDSFTPLLQQPFQVGLPTGETLLLVLVETTSLGRQTSSDPQSGRQPFSLLFRGPLSPVLPQSIYSFTHPDLGENGIFIVPIGPREGGMTYEAIFT